MTLELVRNNTNLPIIKMMIHSQWMHFIVDTGAPIHGLIGQDVLGQLSSYSIDNKKQRITFNK